MPTTTMNAQENNQLRELIQKKMQEYNDAIAYITERCEMDDMTEEAHEETHHLRNACRHARNFLYQIREADDNWVEATLNNVKAPSQPASPFEEFIGKKLHYYDSWNGSSCNITIEEAGQTSDSVHFIGTNSYGGKSGIYVDNDLVDELLKVGYAERHREIDHCDVTTRWNLN